MTVGGWLILLGMMMVIWRPFVDRMALMKGVSEALRRTYHPPMRAHDMDDLLIAIDQRDAVQRGMIQ